MYQRLQGYARKQSCGVGSELRRYLKEYQAETRRFQRLSHKRELVRKILQTPIVIVGDYHTNSQAQRTLARLLREAAGRLNSKPVVIAIEWLCPQDNFTVNRYLRDEISEDRFLSKVRFHSRWGFEWRNYRGIFEIARQMGFSIVGLSKKGEKRLKCRDRFAAQRIASLFQMHPKAQVFALVGDLHLASVHLPRELNRELNRVGCNKKTLLIHQNIESFYWELLERGLDQVVDVVMMRRGVYCVLNTPPWLKLQSHLKWLEVSSQTQVSRSLARAFSEIDFSEELTAILEHLHRFLGVVSPPDPDIRIIGPRDVSFVSTLKLSKNAAAGLRACIVQSDSLFIPGRNIVYLCGLSSNQLASQTAAYLHCRLTGLHDIFYNPRRDFYRFVWMEAMGYLGSKILNPKRRCLDLMALERISVGHLHAVSSKNPSPFVARWCAEHIRGAPGEKSKLPSRVSAERLAFYYQCAKVLGHLLGNGLYEAVLDGRIDRITLRGFFASSPPSAQKLYTAWVKKLSRWSLRKRCRRGFL